MARSFQELKGTRQQQLDNLRAIFRFDLGSHKRTRLVRAGRGKSATILHDDVAKHHAEMLFQDYRTRLANLSRVSAKERLRFITILHSVVNLRTKDTIRAVEQMERSIRLNFTRANVWVLGAVEVEVTNIGLRPVPKTPS